MVETTDDLYAAMTEVMAACYRSIDWSKAGQKSAYDYFASRVRSSGYAPTVPAALERLARRCNVISFDLDLPRVRLLDSERREVLRRMRDESVYVALLAAKRAKELKNLNKSLEGFDER